MWDSSEDQADKLGGVITLYPGDSPTQKSEQDARLAGILSELRAIPAFQSMETHWIGTDQHLWKRSYAGAFYPKYPGPAALFQKALPSQLYFIGSDKDLTPEGKASEAFGYMEGGVRSAGKATRDLLQRLR